MVVWMERMSLWSQTMPFEEMFHEIPVQNDLRQKSSCQRIKILYSCLHFVFIHWIYGITTTTTVSNSYNSAYRIDF